MVPEVAKVSAFHLVMNFFDHLLVLCSRESGTDKHARKPIKSLVEELVLYLKVIVCCGPIGVGVQLTASTSKEALIVLYLRVFL